MRTEFLPATAWTMPKHYFGFSPDGDYCVLTRHRDSEIIDESNWDYACRILGAEPFDNGDNPDAFQDRPMVYHWRAGHCLVGWVEYLMVRKDAPAETLAAAEKILSRLDGYPILDEDDFSQREWDAACDYWQQMPVRERVELLQEARQCIFAARRDDMPQDDTGYIFESLTR